MRFNSKILAGAGFGGVLLWTLYYVILTNHWNEPIIIDNPTVTVKLASPGHEGDVHDKGNRKWRRSVHYRFAHIKITGPGVDVRQDLSSSRVTVHFDKLTADGQRPFGQATLNWGWFNTNINLYGSIDVDSSQGLEWKKDGGKIQATEDGLRIARVEYEVGGVMQNRPLKPEGEVQVTLCTSDKPEDCK